MTKQSLQSVSDGTGFGCRGWHKTGPNASEEGVLINKLYTSVLQPFCRPCCVFVHPQRADHSVVCKCLRFLDAISRRCCTLLLGIINEIDISPVTAACTSKFFRLAVRTSACLCLPKALCVRGG